MGENRCSSGKIAYSTKNKLYKWNIDDGLLIFDTAHKTFVSEKQHDASEVLEG